MKKWFWRVVIAFDHFANAIFRGLPGQTISARAYTARQDRKVWGCVLCRFLDWLEADHCEMAAVNDIKRAEAVVADLKDRFDKRTD